MTKMKDEGLYLRITLPMAGGQKRKKQNILMLKKLKAVYNGLLELCSHIRHKHIKLYMDNMTAVVYI